MKNSTSSAVRRAVRVLAFAATFGAGAATQDVGAVQNFGSPDIVYLNRCAAGCMVHQGSDDAANHASSIINGTFTVPPFAYSDSVFDQVAACARDVLLPFDVHVVANDPGQLFRREIMLTTLSQSIGLGSGITAEAPFDGFPKSNTIGFVFATTLGGDVDKVCEATAYTIGNLYGLDIVTSCSDIMSFGTGCGEKTFLNADSPCDGAISGNPGHCIQGNTTQNSFAVLMGTAGPPQSLFINSFEGFEVPQAGPAP